MSRQQRQNFTPSQPAASEHRAHNLKLGHQDGPRLIMEGRAVQPQRVGLTPERKLVRRSVPLPCAQQARFAERTSQKIILRRQLG